MRRNTTISWLIIVAIFSGLMLYSISYEVDVYYGVSNFDFLVNDVTLIQNSTNDIVRIEITADLWNPSYFTSFLLRMIDGHVYLNGEASDYIQGSAWVQKSIAPRSTLNVSWSYNIFYEDDIALLNAANTTGIWNWFIVIQVSLVSEMIDWEQYDRSQLFEGVNFRTI